MLNDGVVVSDLFNTDVDRSEMDEAGDVDRGRETFKSFGTTVSTAVPLVDDDEEVIICCYAL